MPDGIGRLMLRRLRQIAAWMGRPEFIASIPAISLLGYVLGGERVLMILALGLPVVLGVTGVLGRPAPSGPIAARDGVTGLGLRETIVASLDTVLASTADTGRTTGCFVVMLDEIEVLAHRHGHAAKTEILRRTGERLTGALRQADVVARLDGGTFAVALGEVRGADLESMLQLANRLQAALDAPISLDSMTVYVSTSIGFCLAARAPDQTGLALLDAAETAALDARRNGPGAIRSYTSEMQKAMSERHALRGEIEVALDTNQIVAYFQPQVSTDTGEVTGFETLARWHHPQRGVLSPGEFLDVLRDAGLSERLSEVMTYQALTALRGWDKLGAKVPCVGVNFSTEELRNPNLAEKLKWDLDRFDIQPERLTIEILETVVADTANDVIVQNIAALSKLGCGIDLDDFGTGHASIANIRRFAVSRLKIDRSFVTHVDQDRDQQIMVTAILSMAERLGLETLAEGVESIGEHAMLAQLGCGHVQGFGLARPMKFDETVVWIEKHQAKLALTPKVTHRTA